MSNSIITIILSFLFGLVSFSAICIIVNAVETKREKRKLREHIASKKKEIDALISQNQEAANRLRQLSKEYEHEDLNNGGSKMSEWISVNDRSPDRTGDYLICEVTEAEEPITRKLIWGKNVFVGGFYAENELWRVKDRIYGERVYNALLGTKSTHGSCGGKMYISHWMPMPEPPKEFENG